ncbi:MAG: serine hydrolase [Alphaproteobacteria bacterium]|nr:serine hydrolase [Alphaproteobacteria bacterium]
MLAAVPAARIEAITRELRSRLGKALAVTSVVPSSAATATVAIRYARGMVSLRMAVEPGGRIGGLLVIAADQANDSVEAVLEDLKRLHGQTGIAIAALGDSAVRPLGGFAPARPMAIGSGFKLFVLAELVRAVKAGERKWSDVVPLGPRSLPSGILQEWPEKSPLTLHSLAALMISLSDNSAADTLLHLVGREKVERLLPELGLTSPGRTQPFLSTLELFAIKADPALTARWATADETGRRALLSALPARVDSAALAGPPRAIGTVEWYASPDDLVRTMDWLRRNADSTALDILAINPGLGPGTAEGFDYLGYKGGSETGVIAMTFLLRRKDGGWRALSASWNDPTTAVDEARFVALMQRLVALQR